MKSSITVLLALIVGIAAGGVGAYAYVTRTQGPGASETNSLNRQIADLTDKNHQSEDTAKRLKIELDQARKETSTEKSTATGVASEHDRLAREKGEAIDRADKAETELRNLKIRVDEDTRQDKAAAEAAKKKVSELEKILDENGIYSYLTPEEIKAKVDAAETLFKTAFDAKDKNGVLKAMADLQKLGPTAYDKTIELWMKVATDYGTGKEWGKGPNTLGLSMGDISTLVSNWDLIKYGVTADNVPATFKVSSLYGLPWRASVSASERAQLAGQALEKADGYTAFAAVNALDDIKDPSTAQFLMDYVQKPGDNTMARTAAVEALAGKNTPEAWAVIEKISQNDTDEKVKAAAQQQMMLKNAKGPGVLITRVFPGSQAALAGIQIGDVMISYNGKDIRTLNDIAEAKKSVPENQGAQAVLMRNGQRVTVVVAAGTIGIDGTDLPAPK